jgi:hypothetical protein
MAHPAAGVGLDALFVPIRMDATNLARMHGAEQWPAAGHHAQLLRRALAAQNVGDGVVQDIAEDVALDHASRRR